MVSSKNVSLSMLIHVYTCFRTLGSTCRSTVVSPVVLVLCASFPAGAVAAERALRWQTGGAVVFFGALDLFRQRYAGSWAYRSRLRVETPCAPQNLFGVPRARAIVNGCRGRLDI